MRRKPVALSPDSAYRTMRAVQAYERSGGSGAAGWHPYRGDDGGDPVRVGKTTAEWRKGTLAEIDLWEQGEPPNESHKTGDTLEDCMNLFVDVKADRWVIVARAANGSWYLISAEC